MSLGTLDRNPPPLFQQGLSAASKLAVYAALAIFLMVADARFNMTQPLRMVLATALHPMQRALLAPVDAWEAGGDYLRGMERATEAENQARRQLVQQAEKLSRSSQLQVENERLRALLKMQAAQAVPSMAAEVLYEAADPYSRRVVIDHGSRHGVRAGAPVINDTGVLGQVTRVYLLSSEVTLLGDKDAAIPVLNNRTQQRGVAYGGERSEGPMELRFMAANADIKVGDLLSTSGLDGVYPPGLPVATVAEVERRGDTSFARVSLKPASPPDAARHVLILEPLALHEAARTEAAAANSAEAASAAHRKAEIKADAKAKAAETRAAAAAAKATSGGER